MQWHNLAFVTTRDFVKVPTKVLHYEDYASEETLEELLVFLRLDYEGLPLHTKFAPHDYSAYFSQEERRAVKQAAKLLASPETWKHLQRYF